MNKDIPLLIGTGILLTSSVLVGKVVVEQISESEKRRKKADYDEEGFEAAHAYAYGLQDARDRPVPLHDIVRFLGTLFGLYTLYKQAPALLQEWQKLSE